MRSSRTTRWAAAAAVVAAMAVPATASAGVAVYPGGETNDFTGSPQGWAGTGAVCSPLNLLPSTCSSSADYDGTAGNGGALAAASNITLNLLSLFKGESTFTSPNFTIPTNLDPTGAALAFDRSFEAPQLVGLSPTTKIDANLIDRTTGTAKTLATETLSTPNAGFASKSLAVDPADLVPGHTYALGFHTTSSTSLATLPLQGRMTTRYDNVRLAVSSAGDSGSDRTTPVGTEGATGSPGVTVNGPSLSNTDIRSLIASLNYGAEVGKLAGGSIVPRSKCTIIGTAGNDRIVGTSGNDVICGLGGNDRISGAGGMDVIDTGSGNDTARGGTSTDVLIGVAGKDRLNGESGNDRIGGGRSGDRLNGGTGSDRVLAGTGNDIVSGASGNDRLNGGKGRDRLAGDSGNDRIAARDRQRDLVDGGTGRDKATYDRRSTARSSSKRKAANRRADRVRRV